MSVRMQEISTNLGDAVKKSDLADIKKTKADTRGEESTDDQAYSSTDEGLSNSDSDSSRTVTRSSTKESPSRRGSNASVESVPEKNITELLPSVGSANHFTGECSRCCFFPKGRCNNGKNCNFCHLDHDRRPRRSKRGGAKNKTEEEDKASESEVQTESSEQAAVEHAAPAPLLVKPPGLPTPVFSSSKPMMLPPPLPAFPVNGTMQQCQPHCIPTPMGYNSARFYPAPASLQSKEAQEAAQMMKISGGKPVKVWLPDPACPSKQLQPSIPAKKRPPYPESVSGSRPVLESSQPVKKRVPVFSEGFLKDLLSEVECVSTLPNVVPSAPTVLAPR